MKVYVSASRHTSNARKSRFRSISVLEMLSRHHPVENNYPTLLGSTASAFAHIILGRRLSPKKLEAMVKLGIANSRMKDFYDMEALCRTFSLDGKSLRDAIHNTFKRRGTELPLDGTPLAFTLDFYEDVNKIREWIAFSEKNRSYVEPSEFKTLVAHIAKFLVPVTSRATKRYLYQNLRSLAAHGVDSGGAVGCANRKIIRRTLLSKDRLAALDLFDRLQLASVIKDPVISRRKALQEWP